MIDMTKIATVCKSPLSVVQNNWPKILKELENYGISDDLIQIAAIATICVETARSFKPINEFGNDAYFTKHYENRADLGNNQPGDGIKFHGRGFIQITGRLHYEEASKIVGQDLVANPELALDPAISAKLFAWYFSNHPSTQHNVATAALAKRWDLVRERVNGGTNGMDVFMACVNGLLK